MLDRIGGLMSRIGRIVRSAHERWDGRGYPDGLRGEAIPVEARVIFACDAFNAMTTDRPYRPRASAIVAAIQPSCEDHAGHASSIPGSSRSSSVRSATATASFV